MLVSQSKKQTCGFIAPEGGNQWWHRGVTSIVLIVQALQVLEFLMKRGSDQCVKLAQVDIRPHLQNVKNFEFTGNDGRDYGINVRVRWAPLWTELGVLNCWVVSYKQV